MLFMSRFVVLMLWVCAVSACQPAPAATTAAPSAMGIAATASLPPPQVLVITDTAPPPTATPTVLQPTVIPPSATGTPTAAAPQVVIVTNTMPPSATPRPTGTGVSTSVPTAVVPTFVDHYWMARPIGSNGIDYSDRTYVYGSTQLNARAVHLGADFANPRNTPVLAVADGVVYYAGEDLQRLFGPQADYYGRVIVILHDPLSPEGLPVYSLYGHLQTVEVSEGQVVTQGQPIGKVGDAGVAIGAHLHFEVRVGDPEDYRSTRNPDLWITPYPSFGTLAGLLTDAAGVPVRGVPIIVRPLDPALQERYTITYEEDVVNSDAAFGENFTYGDLPEGDYEVLVSPQGRTYFRQTITITRGRTTWVQGVIDFAPTPYPTRSF
jgi:murein DD-endopeptidase MepM/ murein hydrolase activator NlpD